MELFEELKDKTLSADSFHSSQSPEGDEHPERTISDNFTDEYKQLTKKIRDTLEPIFQEYAVNGRSRKGVGMAAIDVVYAMVPSLADEVEPFKKED